MALITNGKIYRNLEEQVRKNQEDIENALSLQNLMGINVVGNVPAENMLPDPELYTGEYGDAYAVGLDYPYIYFAFTRPTNVQPKTIGSKQESSLELGLRVIQDQLDHRDQLDNLQNGKLIALIQLM